MKLTEAQLRKMINEQIEDVKHSPVDYSGFDDDFDDAVEDAWVDIEMAIQKFFAEMSSADVDFDDDALVALKSGLVSIINREAGKAKVLVQRKYGGR